jgi:hypothetical protein
MSGMSDGMSVYARLGGTSQVEGVANQKLAQLSSWNAGPELMSAELCVFVDGINVRSRVKHNPDFKWIGYSGYSDLELIQRLHENVYGVAYPYWYCPISNFVPTVNEPFGILPLSANPKDWQVLTPEDSRVLTSDDAFLARKQRSKVYNIFLTLRYLTRP